MEDLDKDVNNVEGNVDSTNEQVDNVAEENVDNSNDNSDNTQPEASEGKQSQSIPYNRFKEVNEKRKETERQLAEANMRLSMYEKNMLESKQAEKPLSKSEKKRLESLTRYSMTEEDRADSENDVRAIAREEWESKINEMQTQLQEINNERLFHKREMIMDSFIKENKDFVDHDKTMGKLFNSLPTAERKRLADTPDLLKQYLPMFLSQARKIDSESSGNKVVEKKPVNTSMSTTKVGNNNKGGKKIWKLADIAELGNNPKEYAKLKPEIDLAFAEGRIVR